jgi:hypothetical protein
MANTPNMNLTLPVPTVTLGPVWAMQQSAVDEQIDAHDHSSGKGVKVTPAGLNINTDLSFNGNKLTELKLAQLEEQSAALTGAANANGLHSVLGNLYWTNNSGVAVQLTAGGAIVSTPGAVDSLQFNSFATDVTISPADPFVVMAIDTSAARVITLPLASSVSAGRIYVIADSTASSETNPMSIATSGSDTLMGAASYTVESNGSATMVIGDGISKWVII